MPSLKKSFIEALNFNSDQMAVLRAIGGLRGKQELFYRQVPEALKTLQYHATIESSESSNRIEGIVADHQRIKSLVIKSSMPQNRSEQEIAGYRDALALIHDSANEIAISPSIILQFHNYLHRYMHKEGGVWKNSENEIVEKNEQGEITKIRFKPVSALQTPFAMDELTKDFNERVIEEHEPLILIPLFILDFLCVHPFSDGNGRISRLLTLLLLYRFGYTVGRYISLERIIEESKETYYETLEECSRNWHNSEHQVAPWLNYFWGFLLRAYNEFEEKTLFLTQPTTTKRDFVTNVIDNWSGYFTISDLEKTCPAVSRDMIRLVLKELRELGKIKSEGKGRGSKWRKAD